MKTLQEARKEKGLTQFQLAVKAGIQPQSLSDIERGLKGTTLKTLNALCKVLEVDPREVEGVIIKKRTGRYGWTVVDDPFHVVS